VTGYRLYLGGSQVGTSPSTSYAFSGLTCGTSYTLGVAAVDAAGNVSGTATASAQTSACSGGGNFSGTFDCYDASSCPANELASAAVCRQTLSGGNGLQTALNNATGGEVICLSGSTSYGNISLGTKVYSSDVIIQPANGANARIGSISLAAVQHLHFTGNGGGGSNLTIGQTNINGGQSSTATNRDLTFDYLTSDATTGCWQIWGTTNTSNILLNHTRHDGIDKDVANCRDDGRVLTRDASTPPAGWIVISNSRFGGGGCSDGIQLEASRETIGPGNEFADLVQGSCGPHVDAIQMYGDNNALFIGNYFHGNSDGIVNNDNRATYTVRNNVVIGPFETGAGIAVTGGDGIEASHNTVVWGGGNTTIGVDKVNDGNNTPATNAILSGNVTDGGHTDQCANCTATWTYNLGSGRAGTGNISGTPVYVSSPASGYYHYQLAPGSPGYHAASDGKSMGIAP
jgi:hypothetical protein